MALRPLLAAALCIYTVSAGLLPASTQVFIPAASPTPFIYLDQQPQQHETLTAHQPLTYQLSLAYPGAPTAATPIATSATLTGISGANVVTESVSSRAGDRISSSGLERTSGIDRQREHQQQQQIQQRQQQFREEQQLQQRQQQFREEQQMQQRQQQFREEQQIQQRQQQQQQFQQQQFQQQQIQEQQQRQQQQQQQQAQQRQRFEYSVNEVGRREGVDALRQAQNQQQQLAQQQQYQQHQFAQQLQQQQLQDQQRYDYSVNEAAFDGISREGRPETADVNLDVSRHGELNIQSRNRASYLAEQHGVPQTQAVEGNVHRRPDISSLTLSLQRQGHGSFSTGSSRSQIPGSLSIQRQRSQTEQRIAFQGVGVDAESARYQQRQREQQAAAARVAVPASAPYEEAQVRAFPTVLPTLAPTVASVTAHGLPQAHPADSGFSSYSVRFVSPQFGYGYYGDQHSLQQQSSILVRSNIDGSLASNAVGAPGDIVGNH